MSDSSSGSSTNSWTLLSPEEAASDTAGPVDDGTESTGDVPSLSEEVAGSAFAVKRSDSEVLSEEGHQVCQETSPELFDEGAVSGPTVEAEPEICAPVIHATITTSPPDNDLLGAVPFSLATESSFFLSQDPFLETAYEESLSDIQPMGHFSPKQHPIPEIVAEFVEETDPESESVAETEPSAEPSAHIGPTAEPTAEIALACEHTAEIGPASEHTPEIGPASEHTPEIGPASESTADIGPTSDPMAEISPHPESPVSDVTTDVRYVSDMSHTSAIPVLDIHPELSSTLESSSVHHSSEIDFTSAAASPYPKPPASSVSDEKELVTDIEQHKSVTRQPESLGTHVHIEPRLEDSGLRLRHAHYPEEMLQNLDEDDGEETEFTLPERKEEKPGLSMSHLIIGALALLCLGSLFFSGTVFDRAGDDYDGAELSDQELLEKLVAENKQISILEAQIQAQKEELDRALRAAAEKGVTDEEHARMKEELSALPQLREELETLKARVSELTQLAGSELSAHSPGLPEEGQHPAGLDGQRGKKDELKRQKVLLEQSKMRLEGMKKPDWPKKWVREGLVEMQQRLSEQVDRIGKKDEWRRKHQGGETRKNERSDGVQEHKETLKKYHDEWEHRKPERKVEREKRKQERTWQVRPDHKQKHDKDHHHHESKDFWNFQEKKLRRHQKPPEHCHDVTSCAKAEGLIHVKLSDFQGLLDTYLNKLQGLSAENKEAFHHLVGQFFHGGVFKHDRMLFREFAEDMADILEDLADVVMDDDALEEEMEEFEREVLWLFAE